MTAKPGIYVIKGGDLSVGKGGKLRGVNVGLYLTGAKASAIFAADSTIDLTAPKDGPMAGLLIWQNANSGGKKKRKRAPRVEILSNNARNLLGTIYLPRSALRVGAKAPVADRSAYTVLIVKSLQLFDGPDLHLNTNYGDTDVPVPNGVGPTGRNIHLVN